MKSDDGSLVLSVLKNLYIMISEASKRDKQHLIINELVKNNKIKVIEDLQLKPSKEIYKFAYRILNDYFVCEDVPNDEGI
jgi:hypothetical protein